MSDISWSYHNGSLYVPPLLFLCCSFVILSVSAAVIWIFEISLWPLGINGSGRDRIVERMEERNQPGPNLKVPFRHLPGGTEKNPVRMAGCRIWTCNLPNEKRSTIEPRPLGEIHFSPPLSREFNFLPATAECLLFFRNVQMLFSFKLTCIIVVSLSNFKVQVSWLNFPLLT